MCLCVWCVWVFVFVCVCLFSMCVCLLLSSLNLIVDAFILFMPLFIHLHPRYCSICFHHSFWQLRAKSDEDRVRRRRLSTVCASNYYGYDLVCRHMERWANWNESACLKLICFVFVSLFGSNSRNFSLGLQKGDAWVHYIPQNSLTPLVIDAYSSHRTKPTIDKRCVVKTDFSASAKLFRLFICLLA